MSRHIRIALLTPYTGDNLGDAAIQEAVISNVKKRYEDADICLITYSPVVTAKLHRVRSFPIGITTFSPGSLREYAYSASTDAAVEAKPGLLDEAKRVIKNRFPFYARLKRTILALTPDLIKIIASDALHAIRAYSLARGVHLIIVSGGGQLDEYHGGPWRQPYSLLKWALIARLAGARYIFLSVGTCSIESRLSKFFLRHALKLAAYRSYRDQKSKQLLERMKFTHDDLVCPDLAFSYVSSEPNSNRTDRGRVVGISPISYLSRRWKETNLREYEKYISSLAELVRHVADHGYEIILFSTDAVDFEALDDLETVLARSLSASLAARVSRMATSTMGALFRCLSRLEFVIASRLHGVILSHRAGLPVLAISYDRKVTTHMFETQLSEYCVDFHSIDFNILQLAFGSLVQNADSIRSELEEINTRYSGALTLQYDRVLVC